MEYYYAISHKDPLKWKKQLTPMTRIEELVCRANFDNTRFTTYVICPSKYVTFVRDRIDCTDEFVKIRRVKKFQLS